METFGLLDILRFMRRERHEEYRNIEMLIGYLDDRKLSNRSKRRLVRACFSYWGLRQVGKTQDSHYEVFNPPYDFPEEIFWDKYQGRFYRVDTFECCLDNGPLTFHKILN